MYFYSLIENLQLRIAAPKFEFGCGFYFCVIGALKYIIGQNYYFLSCPANIFIMKLKLNLFRTRNANHYGIL